VILVKINDVTTMHFVVLNDVFLSTVTVVRSADTALSLGGRWANLSSITVRH
jgi:hypothetical protein